MIRVVNMNLQEMSKEGQKAYKKVTEGDLNEALEIANNIKNKGIYGAHYASGILINIGNIQQKKELVKEGTELLEKDFDNMKKLGPSTTHYNIANGYFSLFEFKKTTYNHYLNDELHKAKYHFRKALENDPNTNLKVQIYINLANCLDTIGRSLDGLELYEKALEIDPNHPMALGNKGIALKYYSDLMGKYPDTFLIEAHFLISKALDLGVPIEAKIPFTRTLKNIEKKFQDKNKLKKTLEYPGCKIPESFKLEKYYNQYCLNEKLFLNICNYCQKCDAALGDSIVIQRMQVPISDDPLSIKSNQFLRSSAYLNQIKQDYVAAKFLLVLSQYKGINLDFVDKNVKIINTFDYQQNNIYIQLVKLSFKNLYDVLDKIAFFINDYLELKENPRFVSFDRIWYSDRKKKILREKIKESRTPSLRALFDIHKDLENNKDPERGGYYYSLKYMRNALTHRFINIKLFLDEEDEENIKEETLIQRTLELARLVRNAVIYLINFVQQEESTKNRKQKLTSLPLTADEIPDNMKSNRKNFFDI